MLTTIARRTHALFIDLKYGGILKGSVPSEHPDAFNTENSGYDVLGSLLRERVRPGDIFVDIGCGKGRALNWWIDNYPATKGYGIEINEKVAKQTQWRLRKYKQISVLAGDALQLIPHDASLFYLFNPFGEELMMTFADKLRKMPLSSHGLPRRTVYYNARYLKPFGEGYKVDLVHIPHGHRCAVIDVVG